MSSKQNGSALLILLIAIVLPIITAIIILSFVNTKPVIPTSSEVVQDEISPLETFEVTEKTSIIEKQAEFDIEDFPELYPDTVWERTGVKGDEFIYIKDQSEAKSLLLEGEVWTSYENDIDKLLLIEKYFSNELRDRGYVSQRVNFKNLSITPMLAGGPMGDSIGYLVSDGNNIKHVVVSVMLLEFNNGPYVEVYISETVSYEKLMELFNTDK